MATKTLKKDKAHQQYHIEENGKRIRVPGVTTICGVLAKPALIPWANRIGLEGIDVKTYVDTRASMGTCAHNMVEAFLRGEEFDTSEFSQVEIDSAENSVLSFYSWLETHEYEVIGIEMQLSSPDMRVGGTIDIYWTLDGVLTLTDLKTGKAIYRDMGMQVSAYAALLREEGHQVDRVSILNIPRAEDEEFRFEVFTRDEEKRFLDVFEHCRAVYELKKSLRWY